MASRSSSGSSMSLSGHQYKSEHSDKQENVNQAEHLAESCEQRRTVVGHAHLCISLRVDTDLIRLPRFPVHLRLRLRRPSRQLIFTRSQWQVGGNVNKNKPQARRSLVHRRMRRIAHATHSCFRRFAVRAFSDEDAARFL